MPLPLPEGQLIQITYRERSADFQMPSLEAASDHYSLSYITAGSFYNITPTKRYTFHTGYVGAMPPHMYHRTAPASPEGYARIHIKFAPEFIQPLIDVYGSDLIRQIYDHPCNYFSDEYQELVRMLFWDMLTIYEEAAPNNEFLLQGLLFRTLVLVHDHGLQDESRVEHTAPLSEPIIEAIYYMEHNYSRAISIEQVAAFAGYSTAYFSRLFQTQVGKSYSEYLSHIRIRHVQELLINTNKSITEIALETGFKYPSNMTPLFKERTGMTPREFRRNKI